MNMHEILPVSTSRELNIFKLLTCLHQTPNLTVSELSEKTGISQPTVYRLLHQLLRDGLLLEADKLDAPSGRKAILYSICTSFAYYICIALEKGAVSFSLSDLAGKVLYSTRSQLTLPCARTTYLELITCQIDSIFTQLEVQNISHQRVLLIGVAAEADVDRDRGVILQFSGLHCLDNFKISAFLQERYHIPTMLEKHLMIEAFSSIEPSLGDACQNYIYLHIGAGVGATIIIDGKHYLGTNGKAGELVRIRTPAGESWEAVYNTTNLYQQLMYLANDAENTALNSILMNELSRPQRDHLHPLIQVVEHALRTDEPAAKDLIVNAAAGWANMIATLHAFYDPAVILVGGDLSVHTPGIFEVLQRELARIPHFDGKIAPICYSGTLMESISQWFLNDAFLRLFSIDTKDI